MKPKKQNRNKIIILSLSNLLLSVAAIFSSSLAITFAPPSLALILLAGMLTLLWIASLILVLSFVPGWIATSVAILTPVISVIAASQASLVALVLALLAGTSLGLARTVFRIDTFDRCRLHIWSSLSRGIRHITLALTIFLAALFSPIITAAAAQGFALSEDQVAILLKPLEPTLNQLLPGASSDSNLNQIIEQQVAQQFGGQLTSEQQRALDQELARLDTNPGQKPSLTSLVTSQINSLLKTLTNTSPLLTTASLLALILLTILPLLRLISLLLLLLGWVTIKLSILTKLLNIHTQTKEVTSLSL